MKKQRNSRAIIHFFFLFIVFSVPAFSAPSVSTPPSYNVQTYDQLVVAIRETRAASESRIETAVEQEKVREAWEIGKLIDEHILLHKERADYGKQVLERLAKDLDTSQTELSFMLQFARAYPNYSPANNLSWAHYRELLSLNDSEEREEVAKEAEEKNWGRDQVREVVRSRKHRVEAPAELPEITPGPLKAYRIVRLKDGLKIDLGFGVYHDIPQKDIKKYKEGDMIGVSSAADLFTYSALVTQVVDGDTFHALIDLGYGVTLAQRVRLRRIDAPEVLTAQGKEARDYLKKILFRDKGHIILQSRELDQHGRPIADVWVKGKPVDQEMLDQGLAVRISE